MRIYIFLLFIIFQIKTFCVTIDDNLKDKIIKQPYEYIYIDYDDESDFLIYPSYKLKCKKSNESMIFLTLDKKDITDEKGKKIGEKFVYQSKDKNVNVEIKKENDYYIIDFKDNKVKNDLERLKGDKKEFSGKISEHGFFLKYTANNIKGGEKYVYWDNLDIFGRSEDHVCKCMHFFVPIFTNYCIEIIDNKPKIENFYLIGPGLTNSLIINKPIEINNFYSKFMYLLEGKVDLSKLYIKNVIYDDKLTTFNLTNCKNITEFIFPKMEMINLNGYFLNCNNLKKVDLSNITTNRPISLESAFNTCKNLETVIFPENIKVNSFRSCFANCKNLKNVDIKNVEMYPTKNNLNEEEYDFLCSFLLCSSLETIDLSGIKFSNPNIPLQVSNMFMMCNNLKKINMGNFIIKGTMKSLNFLGNSNSIDTVILGDIVSDFAFYNSSIKNLHLTQSTDFKTFKNSEFYKESELNKNYTKERKIQHLFINNKEISEKDRDDAFPEIKQYMLNINNNNSNNNLKNTKQYKDGTSNMQCLVCCRKLCCCCK